MSNQSKASFLERILRIPIHPIVISSFPIFYLARVNLSQIEASTVIRPLIVSILLTVLLVGILFILFRSLDKAALLTSVVSALFFSYGHFYNILKGIDVLGFTIGRHRYLLPVWTLLLIFSIWVIFKKLKTFDWINTLINTTSIIVFGLSLSLFLAGVVNNSRQSTNALVNELSLPPDPPDIYYIVVDSYSRADNLKQYYDYDNSYFMDFLQEQGFYIGTESQANYLKTALSVSSSLNMDWAQNIDPNWVQGTEANPREWIIDNQVRRNLENLGYSIVNLASGWRYTEWVNADYFLTPDMDKLDELFKGGYFTPFEGLLIQSTLLKALIDLEALQGTSATQFIQSRMQAGISFQREIILAEFDNLSFAAQIPGPKFVFAHIISPHTPYFFGPNGETRIPEGSLNLFEDEDKPVEEREALYLDQLTYVNSRLMEAITFILENNQGPTIIVLQSDHGHNVFASDSENAYLEGIRDRAGILNAYYLPSSCQERLYPSISPVNTFRVIFDCVYGGDFDLIEDITWHGDHGYQPIEEIIPEFYDSTQ